MIDRKIHLMCLAITLCLLLLIGHSAGIAVTANNDPATDAAVNVWAQLAKLTGSDSVANDRLGWSVTVSGDTVVVGAPTDDVGSNADQGAAYVFVKPSTGWANMTQTAKLTASDGAQPMTGSASRWQSAGTR